MRRIDDSFDLFGAIHDAAKEYAENHQDPWHQTWKSVCEQLPVDKHGNPTFHIKRSTVAYLEKMFRHELYLNQCERAKKDCSEILRNMDKVKGFGDDPFVMYASNIRIKRHPF